MKAVVGSCIALSLYHPRLKRGVMAHIVLPDSAGRESTPGKFADAAVPRMLELFKDCGTPASCLAAKLAGGANMFGSAGPLQIGDANIEAVARALRAAGIRIAAQDVGGNRGRRVTFECEGGTMIVQSAGQATKTL
jgi:chemotaxis protein CheD